MKSVVLQGHLKFNLPRLRTSLPVLSFSPPQAGALLPALSLGPERAVSSLASGMQRVSAQPTQVSQDTCQSLGSGGEESLFAA